MPRVLPRNRRPRGGAAQAGINRLSVDELVDINWRWMEQLGCEGGPPIMQFSGAPIRLLERRIKESEVRPIKDGNLRTPKPNPPKDAKPAKKKLLLERRLKEDFVVSPPQLALPQPPSFFHLMLKASKNAATADAGIVKTQRKVKLEAMKKAAEEQRTREEAKERRRITSAAKRAGLALHPVKKTARLPLQGGSADEDSR